MLIPNRQKLEIITITKVYITNQQFLGNPNVYAEKIQIKHTQFGDFLP